MNGSMNLEQLQYLAQQQRQQQQQQQQQQKIPEQNYYYDELSQFLENYSVSKNSLHNQSQENSMNQMKERIENHERQQIKDKQDGNQQTGNCEMIDSRFGRHLARFNNGFSNICKQWFIIIITTAYLHIYTVSGSNYYTDK